MEKAVHIESRQVVSTVDALWTLIMSQKKSVQRALAKRLNDTMLAKNDAKTKMTEAEFYAKLDASIADAETGNVISQKDGETVDDFIDRILCTD